MPLIDPRHEPGLASLIVSDGVLFRTLHGWMGISGLTFTWPEVTTPGASSVPLRLAFSTTPYPGRPW